MSIELDGTTVGSPPKLRRIACVALILALPLHTWIRLLVWTAIGFLIYGFYGQRHSRVR